MALDISDDPFPLELVRSTGNNDIDASDNMKMSSKYILPCLASPSHEFPRHCLGSSYKPLFLDN